MRAHHVAVIRGERHQRAVRLAGLVQRLEHAPDLRIHLLRVGVIMRAALAYVVFRYLSPRLGFAAVQPRLSREGLGEALRYRNLARVVAVQVLL